MTRASPERLFPADHVARFVDRGDAFVDGCRDVDALLAMGTLPVLLVPPILPRAIVDHVRRAARAVHRGLCVVDDALAAGAVPPLAWPEPARTLAESEPAGPALRSCRLDAIVNSSAVDVDDAVAFVEVQAGDPSGPGWVDVLADVAAALVDPRLAQAHAPRLWDGLLPLLDDVARARGRANAAHVAFLCPPHSFVASDHDAMAHQVRKRGRRARRVDVDGDLRDVDVVWRDTHDDIGAADVPRVAALARAVAVQNPFRDVRFDDKRCFALLRHPAVASRLSAAERALIAQTVPLSEAVDDDVARRVRADRGAYVVKPADGFGGHGVVIGGHDRDVDVDAALDRAAVAPVIAQRRIDNPPQRVWTCAGGSRARAEGPRFLTWSFWLVDGELIGAFVRAGDGPVVNVHQGGGIGPVWFT